MIIEVIKDAESLKKWSSVVVLAMSLIYSTYSYSDPNTTNPIEDARSSSAEVELTEVPMSRMSFGPGLYMLSGYTGWSINLGYTYRINREIPVYLGLDTGVSVLSVSNYGASATISSIRLLPTVIYRFEYPNAKVLGYAGFSLGPVIETGTVSFNGIQLSGTEVDLEVALRPGVEFMVQDNFSVAIEPRLAIQSGEFVFAPQLLGVFDF